MRSRRTVTPSSKGRTPRATSRSLSPPVVLEARGISVRFGGVPALTDVDLTLRAGRCTALVGENGAGKSTLAKVLSGLQLSNAGTVAFGGQTLELGHPRAARDGGIALVPQEPAIFSHLTVAENIAVADRPTHRAGILDLKRARAQAKELLDVVEARCAPHEQAGSLSIADKHLVSLARALASEPHILILDEVTAALSPREVSHLFAVVRTLLERGTAVVMVTHRLDEVIELAHDILVLRDGVKVVQCEMSGVTKDEIVELMLGRRIGELYPRVDHTAGAEALRIEGLSSSGNFRDFSATLRHGEILGIAGLVGSGRSEIARCLVGIDHSDGGSLWVDGVPYVPKSPRAAMQVGLVYIPEDRVHDGLIAEMSIVQNMSLAVLPRLSPRLFMRTAKERELARTTAGALQVKASSLRQPVATLSGGNQQKVLLGKWLAAEPRVMILDEPTRGVDVGTKAEIHRRISELTREGLGIILISSELEEVVAMSDRVLALFEGSVVDEFVRGKDLDSGAVLRAINGLTRAA